MNPVVRSASAPDRRPERDSLWKVEFYIWFSWEAEGDDFSPGEDVKMATGELLSPVNRRNEEDGSPHEKQRTLFPGERGAGGEKRLSTRLPRVEKAGIRFTYIPTLTTFGTSLSWPGGGVSSGWA